MKNNSKPSFIEEARRKQIIQTAVDSIALKGYCNTSLDDIAKNAGISKSVISYYFKYKDNLLMEMTETLVSDMNNYIKSQVNACETATEKMHAYVIASLDYFNSNRNNFLVTLDIGINFKFREYNNLLNPVVYDICRNNIKKILILGQQRDEFKEHLSLKTMPSIIQGTIDGLGLQWVVDQDSVSLEECKDIIISMIDCLIKK